MPVVESALWLSAQPFSTEPVPVFCNHPSPCAVNAIKSGQIEVRVDKGGVIHAPVGRRSFEVDKLLENVDALLSELNRMRPSSSKGRYMQKMTVSSTMGAGVRVDETTL